MTFLSYFSSVNRAAFLSHLTAPRNNFKSLIEVKYQKCSFPFITNPFARLLEYYFNVNINVTRSFMKVLLY